MRNQTLYIRLRNHAHLQMGTEYKRIIVQKNLLHFHGQLSPAVGIKGGIQFGRQTFQRITVIVSIIHRRAVQTMGCKEISRVAGGGCDHSAGIHIPRGWIYADAVMVCRTVNDNFKPNIAKGSLYRFGQ